MGVGRLCRCPGIVWGPIWKPAHMQLVREHLSSHLSSLSLCGLPGLPGIKSWISVCERKEKRAGSKEMVEHSPKILASKEKATNTTIMLRWCWSCVSLYTRPFWCCFHHCCGQSVKLHLIPHNTFQPHYNADEVELALERHSGRTLYWRE